MADLDELRKMIDRVDACLLQAISSHLALALLVEKAKRTGHKPIVCLARKGEKLAELIAQGKRLDPPLDPNLVTAVWELLHGYFVEEELKQREAANQSAE